MSVRIWCSHVQSTLEWLEFARGKSPLVRIFVAMQRADKKQLVIMSFYNLVGVYICNPLLQSTKMKKTKVLQFNKLNLFTKI